MEKIFQAIILLIGLAVPLFLARKLWLRVGGAKGIAKESNYSVIVIWAILLAFGSIFALSIGVVVISFFIVQQTTLDLLVETLLPSFALGITVIPIYLGTIGEKRFLTWVDNDWRRQVVFVIVAISLIIAALWLLKT